MTIFRPGKNIFPYWLKKVGNLYDIAIIVHNQPDGIEVSLDTLSGFCFSNHTQHFTCVVPVVLCLLGTLLLVGEDNHILLFLYMSVICCIFAN